MHAILYTPRQWLTDPLSPSETKPVETYIGDRAPVLQKHKMDERTYIRFFDWRTSIGIRKESPRSTVALLEPG